MAAYQRPNSLGEHFLAKVRSMQRLVPQESKNNQHVFYKHDMQHARLTTVAPLPQKRITASTESGSHEKRALQRHSRRHSNPSRSSGSPRNSLKPSRASPDTSRSSSANTEKPDLKQALENLLRERQAKHQELETELDQQEAEIKRLQTQLGVNNRRLFRVPPDHRRRPRLEREHSELRQDILTLTDGLAQILDEMDHVRQEIGALKRELERQSTRTKVRRRRSTKPSHKEPQGPCGCFAM